MDAETAFFCKLMELQYGQDVVADLEKLSKNVKWAQGWPASVEAFWNGEAFMWSHKIDKNVRDVITRELLRTASKNNLDIGCGSYSYVPSVGFDISAKMLQFNQNCTRKVQGNLEQKWPFLDNEFDSITAVFVLNYVDADFVLKEAKRVLSKEGTFILLISGKGVNTWQKQKEVNSYSFNDWRKLLENHGLIVESYEKEHIWFFVCRRQ